MRETRWCCAPRPLTSACVRSRRRQWRTRSRSNARRMFDLFYAIDGTMLALAIVGAVCAGQLIGQRIVSRRIVLAPGVLASLAAIALLSYPDVRDLLQLEVWSVAAVGMLAGAAR